MPAVAASDRHPVAPRSLPRTLAALYVDCSPGTFDTMVKEGDMPKPKRLRSKKVWDRIELDEAFEALPRDGEDEGNDWDGDDPG